MHPGRVDHAVPGVTFMMGARAGAERAVDVVVLVEGGPDEDAVARRAPREAHTSLIGEAGSGGSAAGGSGEHGGPKRPNAAAGTR